MFQLPITTLFLKSGIPEAASILLDYKEPSLEKLIAEGRQGGLGLNLVKKIIDKIEIA